MSFRIRELAPQETHPLRRAVSAEGRMDLPTLDYELDDAPSSWHLGAIDSTGAVVAISSFIWKRVPSALAYVTQCDCDSWPSNLRSSVAVLDPRC